MISNNFLIYSGKILIKTLLEIFYFPVWWFTKGAGLCGLRLLNFLSDKQKSLGLWIWIKNLHKPMYGQYDWQGKLISFFMRLVQIIGRSAIMAFWLALALALFCLWLIFPIFVFYQIIYQISG